ncbi:MAG TPA: choloylglycine hydrolase family protein [Pirellulales bacterium]|jgi:choloylglycine hydrolase|nr:choloylglycine hydrolase family protein [Pirellulales bacterium]
MMIGMKRFGLCVAALAILGLNLTPATACTGIRLRANDDTVVFARTLEFGYGLNWDVVVIPRGKPFVGTMADGQQGLDWTTKYGVVGATAAGLEHAVDGVNEAGLAAGIFYMPGYAEYPQPTADDAGKAVAPWEFVNWMLGNYATIAEVRHGLDSVRVCAAVEPHMGFCPPVHCIVHDRHGDSIVIEFNQGQRQVYDAPLGVITNAPTYDWHETNLKNYVGLSAMNAAPLDLSGVELKGFGQGTGLLRMPGDYTPPSRFVRAVMLTQNATTPENAPAAINLANHILDSFDIVEGTVRSKERNGSEEFETTLWTSFSDLKNRAYYFRTYENHRIRKVDLTKIGFNGSHCRRISMDEPEKFEDVTGKAK